MRKIGFIGVYDYIDFVLYIAKILTCMGEKVLIVDGTIMQKAKYIVPTITPSKTYVTEFEDIDVAVGFNNFEEIKHYLGTEELEYDISLVCVDTAKTLAGFDVENNEKNYFVTSFDVYSIKRGLEALSGVTNTIELSKIIYSNDMTNGTNDYLNFLAIGLKVNWNEEDKIYLPFEVGDNAVIYENQRVNKVKFKRLSNQYKAQLYYVSEQILKIMQDPNINNLKKVFKKI